ncbi:hypothetical protein COY88_04195 [Candidatus Roizmanbacteria bacterium CG_4_10_14_0_8_um_filter_35_28]|uniref:Uncharacterized protein n=4 Tax=Candidatus Roizmaniibacteriota TaxID=1752723 RepID=A0A2M7QEG0_9BACT|nr:MAG: hypothetical protein COY88_04195 [Candidatus Roizmanbacteria bacterium CG_4_10_14_0_8_um_filter_35_28]
MTRISRYPVKEEVLEKLFELFFKTVGNKENSKDFYEVINDLLSPTERVMIAKRIAIIFLLIKNIEFQNICQVLKVSSSTVSKFSLLKEKESPIIKNLQGFIIKDEFYDFFLDFLNTLFPPGKYGVNWKDAWERKKESQRRKTYGF